VVLREAARLRATIAGLRAPDAIHAATALLSGCALFVTNDAGFKRVPGLPLVVLDDVIAAP
jgi:predicted nucleic acid-binding protein